MGQTLIVLGALVATWSGFAVLTAALRRRKLSGEHPGVGEQQIERHRENERTPHRSWKDGQRPWH
ncbi:MAG: hypothetical protein ACXVGQ_12950 [Mycobacteriaceae bacterium]